MPEAEALTVLESFVAAPSAEVTATGSGALEALPPSPVPSVPTSPETGAVTVKQPDPDVSQGNGQGMDKKSLPFMPPMPDLPNLPTPGGIGLLLLIVIVLLFAIVPMNANGQTRLQLMWSVLSGKAQFVSTAQQSASPSVPW